MVCVAAVVLGCALEAAEVKLDSLTAGYTTYTHVVVLGANATDLYFTHDQGIANVKLKLLSPELQQRFHYDPKAASDAEREQMANDARYQQGLAAQIAAAAPKKPVKVSTSEESLVDPVSEKSLLGKNAPKLSVEKWLGDKPDLEGKAVLVVFWAPWSMPCRKVIPDLNSLQKKFADKLVVVGLSSESESAVEDAATSAQFPLAVDTKSRLRNDAGITSVPCVMLMDAGGVVRYQGHPAVLTQAKLQGILERGQKEQ